MKAIQFDSFGPPEVLQYRDLPDPQPGPGQVLIRVESASVNYSDTMRRRDFPYPFPTQPPFVPGGEVAGTVHALGPGVDGPPVGTPVFALAGPDGSTGYAQYALAEAPRVIPIPDGLSPDEACGLVVAGGTAMLALTVTARLAAGESVLVEGAGGAVGSFAIQLAKHLGAGTVIGAAGSAERRQAALAAGADSVVDYTADGWVEEVRELTGGGADVVLHCSGGEVLSQAFAGLAPFGRLVVIGLASGQPGALSAQEQSALLYAPAPGQSLHGFNIGAYFVLRPEVAGQALGELVGLVASGVVKAPVGMVLPLSDAAVAHRHLEERTSVGKIVLKPWP